MNVQQGRPVLVGVHLAAHAPLANTQISPVQESATSAPPATTVRTVLRCRRNVPKALTPRLGPRNAHLAKSEPTLQSVDTAASRVQAATIAVTRPGDQSRARPGTIR